MVEPRGLSHGVCKQGERFALLPAHNGRPAVPGQEALEDQKALILDIRTPYEYEDHHIPGTLLVPLDYLPYLIHRVQDREVVVVCEHGNRAYHATYGMPDLWKGKRAYYLVGGMAYWMGMGYEVESGIDENGLLWQKWLEKSKF